jgi:hypothetical protein
MGEVADRQEEEQARHEVWETKPKGDPGFDLGCEESIS